MDTELKKKIIHTLKVFTWLYFFMAPAVSIMMYQSGEDVNLIFSFIAFLPIFILALVIGIIIDFISYKLKSKSS